MSSFKPVTAVLRGFEVLAAVNRLGEASVGRIHKVIGLNPPTIVRMLETLQHAGYVTKHPERAVYMATAKTLSLSFGYERHRELAMIAAPILSRLTTEMGWPSDVGVYDGEAMLVIQTSRGEGRLTFDRRPGYRAPMLATSLGRAYLANCGEDEREEALAFAARSPEPWNDVARDSAKAISLFAGIRTEGYATMHEEYSRREYGGQLWAIGTAVLVAGEAIAALNMMLVKDIAKSSQDIQRYVAALRRAAGELGTLLSQPGRDSVPS
jgi:IclR family mhp operon transcriptional activator